MTGSTGRPPVAGGLERTGPRDPAEVLAEREAIQANLLELDGSFVKRMLEGAALTGQTRPPARAAVRRSFAGGPDVPPAVETVWAAVGPPLDAVAAELASSRALAAGL